MFPPISFLRQTHTSSLLPGCQELIGRAMGGPRADTEGTFQVRVAPAEWVGRRDFNWSMMQHQKGCIGLYCDALKQMQGDSILYPSLFRSLYCAHHHGTIMYGVHQEAATELAQVS